MKHFTTTIVLTLTLLTHTLSAQEASESVFHSKQGNRKWLTYQDNHRALYRIITDEAFSLLDKREEKVSKLNSAAEWKNYQDEIRTVLCSSLSKFEKTPLNARTTGILERDNFTVEKVIFESHPGFYVTAGLFLPKQRQNPAPAVIYACGHTELGFRSRTYQHVILNLVKKGFIVLAFDPLGQGERLQYPDKETGKSKVGGPTREHSYAGVQTLLTGTSLTDYFIWDGIRVLDYLEIRPEVDMKRIGMTGRSGGGTQTAQIAACDDRIYAAAPENYITSFRRLLQSIGPQDAEQNPYNAIAGGFDHADFLHVRAPKPAIMITTTHDFFSIQGAKETFAEVQKSYSTFEKPENIQMIEDFGVHESTKNNREALYAFFQKHLNLPGDNTDLKTNPFSVEELQVTPTGQVQTSYNGETVFSLNQKYYHSKKSPADLKNQISKTAGISFDRNLKAAVYTGKFSKNDIEVLKYFLESDQEDYALPVYVIQKESANPEKITVWFHPEGKEKLFDEPRLTELLNDGNMIISADLPGTGELHDPEFTGDGVIQGIPFNYTFGANLAGKSIPGIQAEAADLLMQFIDNTFHKKTAEAIVQGTSASPFLHYAVLKNTFKKVTFTDFTGPAADLVNTEYYDSKISFSIPPGSLEYYDLPDLIKSLESKGVEVVIE